MKKISLNKFCKQRGIPVSTAYDWLKKGGYDTSKGLNEDMCRFLDTRHRAKTFEKQFNYPVQAFEAEFDCPSEISKDVAIDEATNALRALLAKANVLTAEIIEVSSGKQSEVYCLVNWLVVRALKALS